MYVFFVIKIIYCIRILDVISRPMYDWNPRLNDSCDPRHTGGRQQRREKQSDNKRTEFLCNFSKKLFRRL